MSTKPTLTWLQMLILQTAADDRDGLVIPNSSVPHKVYSGLVFTHRCMEWDGYYLRITDVGRAKVATAENMARMLRRKAA